MIKVHKKSIAALLSLVLLLSLAGCTADGGTEPEAETLFKAGTYTAIGDGRNGPIVVQVDFSDDAIEDIRVVTHNETYSVGNVPLELYPELIVKHQSLAVDIVSGATISSVAFLSAIRQCVQDAGGNPDELRAEIPKDAEPATDTEADIVVVGGGAAGMTAAVYAAEAGKKVILLAAGKTGLPRGNLRLLH